MAEPNVVSAQQVIMKTVDLKSNGMTKFGTAIAKYARTW